MKAIILLCLERLTNFGSKANGLTVLIFTNYVNELTKPFPLKFTALISIKKVMQYSLNVGTPVPIV